MRLTPLSAYERETIIMFDDEEDLPSITTHQRRILTKREGNPSRREDRGPSPRIPAWRQIQPSCAANQHPEQEEGCDQG